MRVAEIMTSPVIGIPPSASIKEAAKLMLASRVSGLPVVTSDQRVVGVITEGDFLRRSELGTQKKRPHWLEFLLSPGRQADEYVHVHGRIVQDVMTPDPVTISPDASHENVVELMAEHKIKRVLVVENGLLVGIVSRADIMRAVLNALPDSYPAPNDDEEIRKAIVAELASQYWSNAIRIKVERGVVELVGAIFDEPARHAAQVAAENVPGVVRVVDSLALIEPLSGLYIFPQPDRQNGDSDPASVDRDGEPTEHR
ncbi:MAG: hypothetical protein ABS76_11370 [Pelagibacterium sp. SCN 64-44]|nr:MAG: hypothetical protein ABS76_11370 [Pelagibacterium sp. SCN 64-44]